MLGGASASSSYAKLNKSANHIPVSAVLPRKKELNKSIGAVAVKQQHMSPQQNTVMQ